MDFFTSLFSKALSAYALTFIIASSSLFEPLRKLVMRAAPWMKIGEHRHFIECRMCVGFYCSLAVCFGHWSMVLPVYGLSYFMATQER